MVIEKTLVSVIMPAYNASAYINDAIQSVLNQSYPHFELLICDDGSKDNTIEVINSFSDNRIKLYKNQKNLGNLKTTNRLFQQCNGEYIVIQDADDYSHFNRFELLLSEFRLDSELGVVGSNYEVISSQNQTISCGVLPLDDKNIKSRMVKEVIPMLYGGVMFKAELLLKVGFFRSFFNRKGYADLDWLARCSEVSKVKNVKKILYSYRKHDDSFTAKSKETSLIWSNIHFLIIEAHKDRLLSKKDFFDSYNLYSLRYRLSDFYVRKSELCFWDKKLKLAYSMLFNAFCSNPFNINIYKTLFFIFKQKKTHG